MPADLLTRIFLEALVALVISSAYLSYLRSLRAKGNIEITEVLSCNQAEASRAEWEEEGQGCQESPSWSSRWSCGSCPYHCWRGHWLVKNAQEEEEGPEGGYQHAWLCYRHKLCCAGKAGELSRFCGASLVHVCICLTCNQTNE